jgi:hypothetical protein
MNRAFLLLLVLAMPAFAREPWPKRAVAEAKLRSERVATATLPKGLREALLSFDEFTQGTEKLPQTLEVIRIDLNTDGAPEYFVWSPSGYSGGTVRLIFQRSKNGYRDIAYIQGGFQLSERYNGFYRIECWAHAGGGELTRTLERYERGRYRLVRIEDYTDDDEPRFVRARNAKEYDHD